MLSNDFKDHLQILRSDDRRGAYVAVIVNEINGRGLTVMADPDLPDKDAWVVDPSGFGLANLKGRAIADEDATPRGFARRGTRLKSPAPWFAGMPRPGKGGGCS